MRGQPWAGLDEASSSPSGPPFGPKPRGRSGLDGRRHVLPCFSGGLGGFFFFWLPLGCSAMTSPHLAWCQKTPRGSLPTGGHSRLRAQPSDRTFRIYCLHLRGDKTATMPRVPLPSLLPPPPPLPPPLLLPLSSPLPSRAAPCLLYSAWDTFFCFCSPFSSLL